MLVTSQISQINELQQRYSSYLQFQCWIFKCFIIFITQSSNNVSDWRRWSSVGQFCAKGHMTRQTLLWQVTTRFALPLSSVCGSVCVSTMLPSKTPTADDLCIGWMLIGSRVGRSGEGSDDGVHWKLKKHRKNDWRSNTAWDTQTGCTLQWSFKDQLQHIFWTLLWDTCS